MKWLIIPVLFFTGYLVGYNSGSNSGYAIAVKFAPECKAGK